MDNERDIDLWLHADLNRWAEQGSLSLDKSIQIENMITELAKQERKTLFTGRILSFLTAVITFLWMLFASCPVAAASCPSTPASSTQVTQMIGIVFLSLLIFICIYNPLQTIRTNNYFEVNYE